jgi:hypothetical protein
MLGHTKITTTQIAVRLEWLQRDPFESHKLRFTKVERECLTKAELLRNIPYVLMLSLKGKSRCAGSNLQIIHFCQRIQ